MLKRALVLAAISQPAMAQERMLADTFLDLLEGRTASFVMFEDGSPAGTEQFLRRDRTVIALPDGICGYGFVYADADAVCFEYDFDQPGRRHCWVPFEAGERLWAASRDGSEIQEIVEITDEPVSCEPPPIS